MNEKIKEFRQVIAVAEKEQRRLKEQRKTVNFKGERTVPPYEATYLVQDGKHNLRLMYAAYGLMRGKTFSEIENNSKHIDKELFHKTHGYYPNEKYVNHHPLCLYCGSIDELLQKYGYEMPYEEKEGRFGGGKYKEYNPDTCEKVVCVGE